MKDLVATVLLGFGFAGLTLAQAPSNKAEMIDIAVVEFTPGSNASGMTYEAKRHLQAAIAFSLAKTRRFHVVDVGNTRDQTKPNLEAINGTSTAPAVQAGKKLRVAYVLTGNVVDYNTGGSATVNTRLVEVATGKVIYADEKTQQSTGKMLSGGEPEMMNKVLRPIIADLTESLLGKAL